MMSFLDAFAPAISRDLGLRCRIKLAQAIWWMGLVTFAATFFVIRAEWAGAVIVGMVVCIQLLLAGASTASIDARKKY
jgi:uncharacterized membrane protein HdeD (DUF308 family)